MALNPFKDSNLADLQEYIERFLHKQFSGFFNKAGDLWHRFNARGKERITVMFIPHSEKRIINFHVSIFAISFILIVLSATVSVTSVLIIRHTSTIKEVSKLKKYGTNSKLQVEKYREEINRLYDHFQQLKPELTHLYSLTPGSDINSLWARGGGDNPTPPADYDVDPTSPPLEILNLQEIEHELKTTKVLVKKIKKFIEYRRKIIENTPSIWPVDGYIVSRFGNRNSPYTFEQEFHAGINIESFPGTEIRSTAPGTVKNISWDPNKGLTISIRHKYGFETFYSHCQRISVKEGQKVKKNEIIGYVGRTGKTTQYICHYQIRIGTEFVDPLPYLNRIIR